MSTRSIVNRAKLEAWASHFAEQKASGLTVADWCQRNGISRNSYCVPLIIYHSFSLQASAILYSLVETAKAI